MPMEGGMPNYFTINGRAYPSTDTIHMQVGETVKVRFIGSNSGFIHPMHIHGGPFEVVARDGETLAPAARFRAEIGRAHVCTPVTNEHLVCRILLEKKNKHHKHTHTRN